MTEKRYKVPIPVSLDQVYDYQERKLVEAGIKLDDIAEVRLSAIVFKNPISKRSVSVYYLQQRLAELGFTLALKDKEGWFGDSTKREVMLFQEIRGMTSTGIVDEATLLAIFDGDDKVKVIID
jgi:peptidoglycan hydrolase-like protein with peptidoglycan-binding domain